MTYFLFGKQASEVLMDEGMDSLIDCIEEGEIEYELYEVNSETNPAELLYTFKKWEDYFVLSFEEYNRINQLSES